MLSYPRWRLLAEATALLDQTLDYDATLTNVLRSVIPTLADCGIIAMTCADGTVHRHVAAHRDPARHARVAEIASTWTRLAPTCPRFGRIVRANAPFVIDVSDGTSLHTAVDNSALCDMLYDLGVQSLLFVPLTTRGRRLGCLALATTNDSNRRYASRDAVIANAIAQRAALAIDHALLYRAAAQAVRARDEMVAVVSHDLKNPLATIQLAVNFLLDESGVEIAHRSGHTELNIIRRAAERMYRLVHDLLDVSAAESGQLPIARAPIAVDLLVADAIDLLRPLAAARTIALTERIDSGLPSVCADRERILQVFSNLGGNAIAHTAEGGRVEFRARRRGAFIELSVIDTGAGISPDELPHVFDRFWQGKKQRTRSGVGLGLAIVRGIVEAHGGDITVDSVQGRGTRFTFMLPVADGAGSHQTVNENAPAPRSTTSISNVRTAIGSA